MSSSTSRSYNSEYSTPRPHCYHGPCHMHRSFTVSNPGTRFWRCPLGVEAGHCSLFVWVDEPFEGNAKTALLECIKKFEAKVDKEKRKGEQILQDTRDEFEDKLRKLRAEKKLLKKALKSTRCRIHVLYSIGFVMLLIWLIGIVVVKEPFTSSLHCLPR